MEKMSFEPGEGVTDGNSGDEGNGELIHVGYV